MMRFPPLGISAAFTRLPTTDLYVLNPLAELRRKGARLPRLRHLVENGYLLGRTGIVVRYGDAEVLDLLRKAGATRLVYVADDDFSAAATDQRLPEGYRARLAAFAEGAWPALQAAADIVVVPGSVLAGIYGTKARIVPPVWHRPPADLDHFANPERIEIAHLGTASHKSDLAEIVSPLAEILGAHRNARLTLFSSGAAPGPLSRHQQVRVLKPMAWWRYRRALPKLRFHLAIYPLAETAFNRARSANKLYENALTGAASLMSPIPALEDAAGPLGSEIFVEGGASAWTQRLHADLSDTVRLRQRAGRTRAHILAADPAGEAARRWAEILAPEL